METSLYADTLGYGVAVEANGRIVAFAKAGDASGSTRLNSDGTLDGTFSEDGKQTAPAALAGGDGVGVDGVVQADGKLLVVGTTAGGDFALARFSAMHRIPSRRVRTPRKRRSPAVRPGRPT